MAPQQKTNESKNTKNKKQKEKNRVKRFFSTSLPLLQNVKFATYASKQLPLHVLLRVRYCLPAYMYCYRDVSVINSFDHFVFLCIQWVTNLRGIILVCTVTKSSAADNSDIITLKSPKNASDYEVIGMKLINHSIYRVGYWQGISYGSSNS